jgi:hypothetical protein
MPAEDVDASTKRPASGEIYLENGLLIVDLAEHAQYHVDIDLNQSNIVKL